MKLTLSFLLAAGAMAACPNACSKHGECGEYDSCNCHAGFQGGDCSERVCMYNWAWVTTAQGDLNFDGDRYDGTVYSTTTAIEPSIANTVTTGYGGQVLLTQAAPGGTWESWPYYGTAQEGHYYMECSNRGICDRTKGDCVCFEGYTGTACNRMACPESCSEHGVCQTVLDFDSTYKLWDKNMARACKCDPGYTGPACQTRECPFGNDPLTKTNELFETQFVDIYSTNAYASGNAGAATLGGYVRLSYTDHHGETYTTAPVQVQAMDGTTAATTVATNVQNALRELPNNVISSSLTVTALHCSTAADATATMAATGIITGKTDTDYYRLLLSGTETAPVVSDMVFTGAGNVVIAGSSGKNAGDALTSGMPTTAQLVARLDNPYCIRLKVNFTDMPGNLNTLVVDHSLVTYESKTNTQAAASNIAHKVWGNTATDDELQITGGGASATTTFGYKKPSTVVYAADIAGAGNAVINGSDIDFSADVILIADTNAFHPNTRIKVECYSTNNDKVGSTDSQWRNLGVYTISATTVPTKAKIVVKETIVSNQCSTGTTNHVRVTQVSNVITVGDFDYTKGNIIQAGDRVGFTISGTDYSFTTTVKSVEYHTVTTSTVNSAGFIILEDESGDQRSADVTAAAGTLYYHSDGTRENVECADRGLCQEDGTCKCFQGYTGDSCSEQKAIAA